MVIMKAYVTKTGQVLLYMDKEKDKIEIISCL